MTSGYDASGIRECVHPFHFGRMIRLIPRVHRESPLGVAPTPSRFSDPHGRYAVLYAASSLRCAFWEAIARGRFTRRKRREMRRQDIETKLVVWLRSTEPLALVDLRADGPVRMGAPTAVIHDAHHAAGRALSAAVYSDLPDVDGILYPSRFTTETCVAVFDRAIHKLQAADVAPLMALSGLEEVLSDYEITLTNLPA